MFGKANRKWVWLLLAATALLVLCLAATGYAQDEIKIIVNGKAISSDVPPQIVDGRTMVPLRAVAEALGCQVSWDGQNSSVIITQSSPNTLQLLTVNGEPTTWSTRPVCCSPAASSRPTWKTSFTAKSM